MSKIITNNITPRSGSSVGLTGDLVSSGSITGTTGTFSGSVSVGGTITYEDVTNVDSVGVITARSDVSIADKIIHTGDTNTAIRFPAADTFTVETAGSERLRIDSTGRMGINASTFNDAGEALRVQAPSGQNNTHLTVKANSTSGYSVLNFGDDDFNEGRIKYDHSDNSMGLFTNDAERVRITSGGAAIFKGGLAEKYENAGTTLAAQSANPLSDGNVILFTGNESGAKTINFTGVHSVLSSGESVSFTAIITPNNSGYIGTVQVDGQAITPQWSGGSAPGGSDAGSSGRDVYTFTIFKTGNGTSDYVILGALANYA